MRFEIRGGTARGSGGGRAAPSSRQGSTGTGTRGRSRARVARRDANHDARNYAHGHGRGDTHSAHRRHGARSRSTAAATRGGRGQPSGLRAWGAPRGTPGGQGADSLAMRWAMCAISRNQPADYNYPDGHVDNFTVTRKYSLTAPSLGGVPRGGPRARGRDAVACPARLARTGETSALRCPVQDSSQDHP